MGYMVMKYTRIQIGDSINDIPSPSLLIDMDALENNYEVVAREYRTSNCKMRQHAKNIKSPQVLKMQMEAGGTVGGVCTAKVSEAEVMFESGIKDILITSEIVDVSKMERMVKLSLNCDLKVVVDNVHSLKELGTIASNFGATVGVLIEVDTSMNRAGVRSVEEGVQLAKLAETLSGITFKGVMSHQSINGWPDRSTRFEEGKEFIGMCLDVKKGIEDAGIKVEIVSSGETYTYDLASSMPEVTEVEGGTYALMSTTAGYMDEFKYAAKILTRVVDVRDDLIFLDVGIKALAAPNGVRPQIDGYPDIKFERLDDTYSVFKRPNNFVTDIGQQFKLLSGQQDILVNRWDQFVAIRDDVVVAVWPIEGRGCHH